MTDTTATSAAAAAPTDQQLRDLPAGGTCYSAADALAQRDLLAQLAVGSPVRQIRWEARKRALEWSRAHQDLALLEDVDPGVWTIELLGNVIGGMKVPGRDGVGTVVRRMARDGQTTLHVEEDLDPRPIYWNYDGPMSPVIVRR